jgi:hypothetical protein
MEHLLRGFTRLAYRVPASGGKALRRVSPPARPALIQINAAPPEREIV